MNSISYKFINKYLFIIFFLLFISLYYFLITRVGLDNKLTWKIIFGLFIVSIVLAIDETHAVLLTIAILPFPIYFKNFHRDAE